MLLHKTARSLKRAFSIRLGGGPELVINADADGVLRLPPERGQPLESGVPIDQANPEAADGLVSLFRDQIIDARPKPAPEEADAMQAAPVEPANLQAPDPTESAPQSPAASKRTQKEAPAE